MIFLQLKYLIIFKYYSRIIFVFWWKNIMPHEGTCEMEPRDLLGKTVRDLVTGFQGVAVAVTDYLYSCSRVTIEPGRADKDGGLMERETFDCLGLEVIEGPVIQRQVEYPTIPMYSMVRDEISGIEGRVVALGTDLYNKPSVGIQPVGLKEDGSIVTGQFVYEARVTVLREDEVPVAEWTKESEMLRSPEPRPHMRTGGPQDLELGGPASISTRRGLR